MVRPTHRPRQPGFALAQKPPPRIIAFEPIPTEFEPRAPEPYRMTLATVVGEAQAGVIEKQGRMTLHCVGDTGGVKRPEAQHLVAQGMERSAENPSSTPVSFCYHLGDVVYYTGEVADYWDQFYEPYEHYPMPIVAIPGNHDGELLTKESTSLAGFYGSFCAAGPDTFVHESRDSGRAAMPQPYVYFTLETPYATFVGLYTNVPEHGRIDDAQRAWFHGEMKAAAKDKALVVALHHPIYSFDDHHSGSSTMALELQSVIQESGRVPNMVLSAHVHNYQRIERKIGAHTVPFFVIGNGGYWNLHYLAAKPGYQDPDTEAKLIAAIDSRHGFMTFEIGRKVFNGNFTTVPRPQESWSDPNAFNMAFDVFSYSAEPLFLGEGETVALVPDDGGHLPPDAEAHAAHHGRRARRSSAAGGDVADHDGEAGAAHATGRGRRRAP